MEWKDSKKDEGMEVKGKKRVRRHGRWDMLSKEANKKKCVKWRTDGRGCEVFGPQARCASCAPRIERIVKECVEFSCNIAQGLEYCPYCKKYYCAAHQHIHRDDKGNVLPRVFPVIEPVMRYEPRESVVKAGKGLVLKVV